VAIIMAGFFLLIFELPAWGVPLESAAKNITYTNHNTNEFVKIITIYDEAIIGTIIEKKSEQYIRILVLHGKERTVSHENIARVEQVNRISRIEKVDPKDPYFGIQKKSSAGAAALSLILPGIGQVYLGDYWGFFGPPVVGINMYFLIAPPENYKIGYRVANGITGIGLWLALVIDAGITGQRINRVNGYSKLKNQLWNKPKHKSRILLSSGDIRVDIQSLALGVRF